MFVCLLELNCLSNIYVCVCVCVSNWPPPIHDVCNGASLFVLKKKEEATNPFCLFAWQAWNVLLCGCCFFFFFSFFFFFLSFFLFIPNRQQTLPRFVFQRVCIRRSSCTLLPPWCPSCTDKSIPLLRPHIQGHCLYWFHKGWSTVQVISPKRRGRERERLTYKYSITK